MNECRCRVLEGTVTAGVVSYMLLCWGVDFVGLVILASSPYMPCSLIHEKNLLDWFCSDAPQGAAIRYGDVCDTVVFCTLVFIVVTGGPTAGDSPTVNHKRNVIKIVHLICQ